MEEKRPGQQPQAEQRDEAQEITERAAPKPQAVKSDRERALIDQAQHKARDDREALRQSGHGDHKGEDGF